MRAESVSPANPAHVEVLADLAEISIPRARAVLAVAAGLCPHQGAAERAAAGGFISACGMRLTQSNNIAYDYRLTKMGQQWVDRVQDIVDDFHKND